jgi:hypothetical protein
MPVTPITSTPNLVDDFAIQFAFGFNSFIGAWKVGSALYAALMTEEGLGLRNQIVKSLDNGATWSRIDDGGGSSSSSSTSAIFFSDRIDWFFGGVFPLDVADINFVDEQTFDIAMQIFQSLITGAAEYVGGMNAVLRSDGSVLCVYGDSGTPDGPTGRIFLGGAFGTPFNINGSTTAFTAGLAVDAADVGHQLFGTLFDTTYQTLSGGGTVSSEETIPGAMEPSDQSLAYDIDKLAFPFIWTNNGALLGRVKLQHAVSASIDPTTAVWNQYDVWTGFFLPVDSVDSSAFAIMDGSDLLVFWINTLDTGIAKVYYAKFNGSGFDAPVLFYDSSLFPPVGATQNPTMRGISIAVIDGSYTAIVGMNAFGDHYRTYYVSNGGVVVLSGSRVRLY